MNRMPKTLAAWAAGLGLVLGALIVWSGSPAGGEDKADSQRRAAADAQGVRTVRSLGAVGDGQADDSDALQQAVNTAAVGLRFTRGVYRITRPIVIELDRVGPVSLEGDGTARIVMDGAGPAFRFVGTHGGTASPATVKPEVWQRQRTPMVDGLEIVGAHAEACGIEATGCMQPTFTRLVIRRVLHGIHLTGRNRNVTIGHCHIYENHGAGVFLDKLNLHQINIANCHISYNGAGGIVVRDSEIRNLQIGTCDIEGNMDPNGPPTANILIDTTNGSVREGAIVGCTIQHTREAADSANIRFLGTSAELPLKIGHFCIADNALSDVAVNIHLKYVRGVTLVNNTFWQGFAHNLLVEGSSNVVVGPNLFDRNPDYRPFDDASDVLFRDCSDCTLSALHINGARSSPAGLTLQRCRWFNVSGCTILDCDGAGLLLEECRQCRVSDCMVRDARPESADPVALRVVGGGDHQVVDNMFAGRVEGL